MHRPQDSAYNLSTSKHDISPSCYERYLQYVPCVLVDLPGGGSRSIESPPAWLRLLAGGRIPSSTVSGRNLLKLNQTFTIWSALFFLPPIKALQTYNKGPSHLFVAILLLMGHYFGSCYKSAGQAFSLSLEHRSLTLGLSGNIDEPMAPRYLPSSSPGALHPSLSQSLEGVLS